MKRTVATACLVTLAVLVLAARGTENGTVELVAHVLSRGGSSPACGSAGVQAFLSAGQFSVVGGEAAQGNVRIQSGFVAAVPHFDTDADGSADPDDADTDGDGVPDGLDARPYDTDGDGANNLADEDDDNDELSDELEQMFGTSWTDMNTDDDAHDDLAEWIAGTDGADSNSVFTIEAIAPAGAAQIELLWSGVAGRSYEVYRSSDLSVPSAWQLLWQTNVNSSSRITYVGDGSVRLGLYRLSVRRQ